MTQTANTVQGHYSRSRAVMNADEVTMSGNQCTMETC